jgi:hypothetical protein
MSQAKCFGLGCLSSEAGIRLAASGDATVIGAKTALAQELTRRRTC